MAGMRARQWCVAGAVAQSRFLVRSQPALFLISAHECSSSIGQVLAHIYEKLFMPAGTQSWEGNEIAAYWQTVGKALITQRLYSSL